MQRQHTRDSNALLAARYDITVVIVLCTEAPPPPLRLSTVLRDSTATPAYAANADTDGVVHCPKACHG